MCSVQKATIEFTYAACCLLCAFVAAVFDITCRRVPNFVTLPAICLGLLLHLIFGSWLQLATAAAAGLLCGSIFLLFYLAGGMGAGDVKLIAAAGCISGLSLVGPLLLFTSLAGGVMAFGLASPHGRVGAPSDFEHRRPAKRALALCGGHRNRERPESFAAVGAEVRP
jgi:prepilin peptidase CpaA